MYIRREQADSLLQASFKNTNERIHAHLAFVTQLLDGDDWSFVIKAQALLEACITEAVLVRLGDEKKKKIVEAMPHVAQRYHILGNSSCSFKRQH